MLYICYKDYTNTFNLSYNLLLFLFTNTFINLFAICNSTKYGNLSKSVHIV